MAAVMQNIDRNADTVFAEWDNFQPNGLLFKGGHVLRAGHMSARPHVPRTQVIKPEIVNRDGWVRGGQHCVGAVVAVVGNRRPSDAAEPDLELIGYVTLIVAYGAEATSGCFYGVFGGDDADPTRRALLQTVAVVFPRFQNVLLNLHDYLIPVRGEP